MGRMEGDRVAHMEAWKLPAVVVIIKMINIAEMTQFFFRFHSPHTHILGKKKVEHSLYLPA